MLLPANGWDAGPKRGFPYTWIPNHLADTEGRVSPRSFLAALKTAAEDTADRHPDHNHALHYDSIKRGVQEASKTRVLEIQEDYPWVHQILSPLGGMTVPCEFEEIAKRWDLAPLAEAVEQGRGKVAPSPAGFRWRARGSLNHWESFFACATDGSTSQTFSGWDMASVEEAEYGRFDE